MEWAELGARLEETMASLDGFVVEGRLKRRGGRCVLGLEGWRLGLELAAAE